MRKWSVQVMLLDGNDAEHEADVFNKVVYNLHPSFPDPVQSKWMARVDHHSNTKTWH